MFKTFFNLSGIYKVRSFVRPELGPNCLSVVLSADNIMPPLAKSYTFVTHFLNLEKIWVMTRDRCSMTNKVV